VLDSSQAKIYVQILDRFCMDYTSRSLTFASMKRDGDLRLIVELSILISRSVDTDSPTAPAYTFPLD
jgi:hypothetical protein